MVKKKKKKTKKKIKKDSVFMGMILGGCLLAFLWGF